MPVFEVDLAIANPNMMSCRGFHYLFRKIEAREVAYIRKFPLRSSLNIDHHHSNKEIDCRYDT
jgi:hypothetical protein